jgi:hypothetical protein
LFVRDGRAIGLSGLFRSPFIPLAISVEKMGLEIVGLESRSGLSTGDFALVDHDHEGRGEGPRLVNVGFSAFHEGRDAEKIDPPGGRIIANRNEMLRERQKLSGIRFPNS